MEQGEVEEENAREEMHSLGGSNANGGKHLANPHHAKDHECEELISPIEFDQEENHPHHDRNENEVLQHVTEY